MRFNRKDSRSLHRRAVLNYAKQRRCKPSKRFHNLQRLGVLKRAREGHCNPDEEEIYAKFINHPFVKYAEKLGHERYLAYDALLLKDEDATTETLLMTVLQTYDSGLPWDGRRYHT